MMTHHLSKVIGETSVRGRLTSPPTPHNPLRSFCMRRKTLRLFSAHDFVRRAPNARSLGIPLIAEISFVHAQKSRRLRPPLDARPFSQNFSFQFSLRLPLRP